MVMLFLEVHLADMNNRHFAFDAVVDSTLSTITDIHPDNTTWYQLSFVSFDQEAERTARFSERFPRKLRLSIDPTVERSSYYFLPLLVFYLIFRKPLNDRLPRRLTSGSS